MSFIKFYILFLVLGLGIWCLMILGQITNPTKSSQWIWDVYKKKEAYAQTIEGPKIVIVSGSNALFGIDSTMLSNVLGYPVLNDAVNAGVGLPVILMHAKRVIKENDIVILPLEYPLYSYDGKPGVQMMDYIYARTPEMIPQLTFGEQARLFWDVTFKRLWEGYVDAENTAVKPGLYGAHHVSQVGDQTGTQKVKQNPAMHTEVIQHTKNPENYAKSYDEEALGWQYLQDFVVWSKKRNVQVIFMPSTLMYHSHYVKDKKEKWFYEHFDEIVKKRGWTYIGKPYDYMYEEESYFNTNFHLTHEAREKRTKKMLEDLMLSDVFNVFKGKKL